MKNKKNIVHQIIISAVRKEQKNQGMFDGRYRTKSENLKNKYTRKTKHKNNEKDL